MTNTPCKNCVFAVYDEKTQKDCKFKMLDVFEQSGARIIAAYDQDAEFFVIEDRLCPFARGINWYVQNKDDVEGQLKRELTYNFNVIMMMPRDDNTLASSVDKILDEETQPAVITFIKTPSSKHIDCKNVVESFAMPKWNIRNTVEDVEASKVLKSMIQLTKHDVYVLVEKHENLPERLLDKINEFGIYGANQFGAILGDGISVVYKNEYLRIYYMDDPDVEVLDKFRQEPELYSTVSLEKVINYEGRINPLSLSR